MESAPVVRRRLLHQVTKKRSVDRVIVVEKSLDLMKWYGFELCERLGAEVVVDDAYNYVGKFGCEAAYLFNIWPSYGGNGYKLKREPKRLGIKTVWAWGSACI